MTTLRILYDVEGWAYYNNAVALQKYAPPDFDVSLAAYLHDSDLNEALGDAPPDILALCRFQSIGKVWDELQRRRIVDQAGLDLEQRLAGTDRIVGRGAGQIRPRRIRQ